MKLFATMIMGGGSGGDGGVCNKNCMASTTRGGGHHSANNRVERYDGGLSRQHGERDSRELRRPEARQRDDVKEQRKLQAEKDQVVLLCRD